MLKTWDEADQALAEMGRLRARIDGVNAEYDGMLNELRELRANATKAAERRVSELLAQLEAFTYENRGDFEDGGKRSKRLANGTVGIRKVPGKLKFMTGEAGAIHALKLRGHIHCIAQTERVDKAAVRKLPAAERQACGVSWEEGAESFHVRTASQR